MDEEKSETYSNDMTQAMGAGMFNHFMVIIQQQPGFILLRGVGYIDQTNGTYHFNKSQNINIDPFRERSYVIASPKVFFSAPFPL